MAQRGSNNYERQPRDYYPTPREPIDALFSALPLNYFNKQICDPCMGDGSLLKVIKEHGYTIFGDDIVHSPNYDFLIGAFPDGWYNCDIITNPPYGLQGKLALQFVQRALVMTYYNGKVAMLLPVDYDSGKTRQPIFTHIAFAYKIVLLNRIKWFNNQAGSENHAWYVWEWNNTQPPQIKYA